MFTNVVKLAKPLSTADMRTKILAAKTMPGRRVLYNTDYGNEQYGMCFCVDRNKKKKTDFSYIHIRLLAPGEVRYEEMISREAAQSDALVVALGKEIEA